jgi:hypothetical protein
MLSPNDTIILLSCALAVAGIVITAVCLSARSRTRKEWLELSTLLKQYSLPHCSAILEDLAVGDLPGAFRQCEYLLKLMREPAQAATALNAVLIAQIPVGLSDPNRVGPLAAAIRSWIAANAAAATAAGLEATTPAGK